MPKKNAAPSVDTYLRSVRKLLAEPKSQSIESQVQDSTNILERIKTEEEIRARRLLNDDKQQDIRLKKITLNRLFLFLAIETALIFGLALLQATSWFGFRLEEWSFKLLISATLLQITAMLSVAVNHLFPKSKD